MTDHTPSGLPQPQSVAVSSDLLDRAAWMCECYAEFIRSDVMSADIERHPYLPELEGVAEDLRAALSAPAVETVAVQEAALRAVLAEYEEGYGLRCIDQVRAALAPLPVAPKAEPKNCPSCDMPDGCLPCCEDCPQHDRMKPANWRDRWIAAGKSATPQADSAQDTDPAQPAEQAKEPCTQCGSAGYPCDTCGNGFPSTSKYGRGASPAPQPVADRSAEARDAARYRFARLGSMTAMVIETNGEILNAGHRYRPHELAMEWAEKIDAAIDAAMGTPQQAEQGSKP